MTGQLFSLDEPRPMSRKAQVTAWVAGGLYLGVSLALLGRATDPMSALLWVPLTHALVLSLVCGLTSLLLYGQARATGRRGYLWLGGTYLYVSVLLLSFPLYFPGSFSDGEPLVGGSQSAPWTFYIWHFAFAAGLTAAVWIFHTDRLGHRRPGLALGVRTSAALTVLGAVCTVAFVAVPDTRWRPTLIVPGLGLTSLGSALDLLLLALSLVSAALALWWQRGGTLIQRWLAAVLVLQLGAAIVNINSDRWSLGWYFDRLFGAFALIALLVILLINLSRLGRATNVVASRDTLTGCESRASFTQSMDREIAAAGVDGQAVALLWVDLDGFKGVNDQFGHTVGDRVLHHTVARILGQVRDADHVGRLGGDEFGVLLCDRMDEARVENVADRILAALREPVVVDGLAIHFTGSIGIATFPTDGDQHEELVTRADLAMYAAKNAGGDRHVRFSGELGLEAMDRAQLRHDLARAVLDRDFDLVFQPIVHMASGSAVGVEALARWTRAGKPVPASEFIEFAEESGQIVAIGRQLLEVVENTIDQVLGALAPPGFLAINISARELADELHVERLLHGPLRASSARIVLEVTESSDLPARPSVAHGVDRLRAAGYRLAVDDFGAGFSNFSRLEQLRPDFLKIDRSLVARAGSGVDGGVAFLAAARSVAESLRCQVVAEGVQTAAERDTARELGITLGQGFLLSAPVPAAALPGVITRLEEGPTS